MKIVNIMGGLGNQMFEYAFAISLKNKFPMEDVYIDTSHYNYLFIKKIGMANLHNGFEIERVFPNAKIPHADWKQLIKVTWYVPNYLLSRIVRRLLPKRKTELIQAENDFFAHKESYYSQRGDCYYEGIWESIQNYIPIRSLLKDVFAHGEPNYENKKLITNMSQENSVGIHIRRGDYLLDPVFADICNLNYYENGIRQVLRDKQKHTFYIFSNDIKWCEKNISPLLDGNKIIYVRHNTGRDSCWDMFLMTYCKSLIIANSSFSWWGAFLNKNINCKVIAPKKWLNRDCVFDIWDPEWIKL